MRLSLKVAIGFIGLVGLAAPPAIGFTVSTTADSGAGSLRQAITDLNNSLAAGTIVFAIPGSSCPTVCTITLAGALPNIVFPVAIDGYTQPGASVNTLSTGDDAVLMIVVDGNNLNQAAFRLLPGAAGSVIRGLVIHNFQSGSGNGIVVQADNCVIEGNFIGTNATGTAVVGQGAGTYGVAITGGSNVRIGGTPVSQRNLISGSSGGIAVYGGTGTGTLITGNYIGTNAAGSAAIGNHDGVDIGLSPGDLIGDVTIGGTAPGAFNLISGNTCVGIRVRAGASASVGPITIQGNTVGLTANGVSALGNGCTGIDVEAEPSAVVIPVLVGGTAAGAGNVIAANGFVGHSPGVTLSGSNVTMQGNYVGTNGASAAGLGNYSAGVNVSGINQFFGNVIVGGTTAGARNVIASSGSYGIDVSVTTTTIQGNVIGVGPDGTTALPNQAGGIQIGSSTAAIGGTAVGAANVIANNGGDGIYVQISAPTFRNAANAAIEGNSIFNNIELGINLAPGGVTPNDPGDGDTGANDLQNFPVLSAPTVNAGNVLISGFLNSNPSTSYRVEFFGNAGCDASGYGEGKVFLGSTTFSTDGTGNQTFGPLSFAFPGGLASVSATATDVAAGNTSEFSLCATPSSVLVASITPSSGSASGVAGVALGGSGFVSGAGVTIGGVAATGVVVNGPTSITANVPALGAGVVYPVTVTDPSTESGTLTDGWFADFLDVPGGSPVHPFVEKLVRHAITAGCGAGDYCPSSSVTRAQMAVFLLRSKNGPAYAPPACAVPTFTDVPCSSPFAPWVNELAAAGVTAGCGAGIYCPGDPVTRAQMAVFLLRMHDGPAYTPPACVTPTFTDVPCASGFAPWVDELALRGITAGCGGGNYCPTTAVTRGQMAVFLVTTFSIP